LLTDLKMPGMDGMELLRRAREVDPALPVILITAFATIESAVAAIKDGAFDYLPKNFSVDQLRVAVERALRQRELERENRNLRDQLQGTLGFENIIGRSPAMTRVFELVRKAARSDANILVLGESGAGKELIAGRSTPTARARRRRSCRSTARRSPRSSSSPSCSATRRARSRAP
jgi:DNA-binding NtrC family response regulator